MLARENFVFTIGYDGESALVDGHVRRQYARLSTLELAQKGLFRAAWASAVHAESDEEKIQVLDIYNATCKGNFTLDSDLGRLFGVHLLDNKKVKII